jgi:ABC-type transport system involved in multi-copper enzyme maturation permease subunit
MPALRPMLLVADREWRFLRRAGAGRAVLTTLFVVAWLPAVLLPLRAGELGLASASEAAPLTQALVAVVVPLLGLLFGAESLSSEIEDGTLATVVTLPISRGSCLAGKLLARAGLASGGLLVAFASAGLAMTVVHGRDSALDLAVVAGSGLALVLSSLTVGLALGTWTRGRLRALGSALLVWLVLVFLVDTILLGLVVLRAPPPPGAVGSHGHAELHLDSSAAGERTSSAAPWLLALTPVGLHRLSVLLLAPQLRQAWGLLEQMPTIGPALLVALGWGAWIAAPALFAWIRFRRVDLR